MTHSSWSVCNDYQMYINQKQLECGKCAKAEMAGLCEYDFYTTHFTPRYAKAYLASTHPNNNFEIISLKYNMYSF